MPAGAATTSSRATSAHATSKTSSINARPTMNVAQNERVDTQQQKPAGMGRGTQPGPLAKL
eukprot:2203780-Lingulodinium_polyedra.AAC.1